MPYRIVWSEADTCIEATVRSPTLRIHGIVDISPNSSKNALECSSDFLLGMYRKRSFVSFSWPATMVCLLPRIYSKYPSDRFDIGDFLWITGRKHRTAIKAQTIWTVDNNVSSNNSTISKESSAQRSLCVVLFGVLLHWSMLFDCLLFYLLFITAMEIFLLSMAYHTF